jgi:hypothetical protein
VTWEASPALLLGGIHWGGIVWAGKNFITNALKSLPSLLTVNHTVLHADLPVCQISVHLAFRQLEEFPIQLKYLSLQA